MLTPTNILIDGDYWPEASAEERSAVYEGSVIALIKDSEGTMYCAFEMPDQSGLQLISLGSRFFKGFTPEFQTKVLVDEHAIYGFRPTEFKSAPIPFEYNKKLQAEVKANPSLITTLSSLGFNLWSKVKP
jgi:hypothetical protein